MESLGEQGDLTDDIRDFVEECYTSTRWYHKRSAERRRFDRIVSDEMAKGMTIETAIQKARRQVPEIAAVVSQQTIPELTEYFSQLRRLEMEITIANNFLKLAEARKRKEQRERRAT